VSTSEARAQSALAISGDSLRLAAVSRVRHPSGVSNGGSGSSDLHHELFRGPVHVTINSKATLGMHEMAEPMLRRMFPNDGHHMDGLSAAIRAELGASGRVLDLGCGANTFLEEYRSDSHEVWGTDFDTHPHLQWPAWFRALHPDGRIPFPDGYFDLVVCTSVLEHVIEPAVFLREVSRVLRPGGCLIGHSISGCHYVTWIRRAIDLLPSSANQRLVKLLYGRPEYDTFPTYYRLNRPVELRRAGELSGLQLKAIRRYADPNYFSFLPGLVNLAVLADWLLEKIAPGWGRLYFTATFQKPLPDGVATTSSQ
jgi:SAM-dependent methyltransferase